MDPTEVVMGYVETLEGIDIEFGRKIWESLRENKEFPIQGIFWLLEPASSPPLPDTGEWRLVIAAPKVDTLGQRDAYRQLAEITRDNQVSSRRPFSIELISPRHPLYQALRSVFGRAESVEGARLANTQVGGMFIDGAYLYQIH
jgi:hypothetical protein